MSPLGCRRCSLVPHLHHWTKAFRGRRKSNSTTNLSPGPLNELPEMLNAHHTSITGLHRLMTQRVSPGPPTRVPESLPRHVRRSASLGRSLSSARTNSDVSAPSLMHGPEIVCKHFQTITCQLDIETCSCPSHFLFSTFDLLDDLVCCPRL